MNIISFIFLFTCTICVLGNFNLTVIHISDFHSHWYEFDKNKHDCSKEESKAGQCYGGFARLLTFIRNIRKKEKNVLVLSSGEFFLGNSLYALHGWKIAHAVLPKLELDAMSLSNHDFDSSIFELSSFLYSLNHPVLCANLIARNTSFLYSRVNKSVVLDVNGTKIGIVGYIHRHALKKTRNVASFTFIPEIPALQEEVSRLENEGVNKIIALGHAGYFTDLEIAKKVKGVDIVIGGDSDIMLFDPGHDADELSKVGNIHGNYPRVHHQDSETADDPSLANRTLVLHIPKHGMYVGVLRATFDDNGKIIHESGEPVLLDNSIPQDKATLEFLEYAKGALEEINRHMLLPDEAELLGVAKIHLDGNPRQCRMTECLLGNFITDAILHEFTFHYKNKSEHRSHAEHWGPIDAVVLNSGTILRSIESGYITIQHIIKSLYLGDFIQRVYMSGQRILDMMEHSVKHYDLSGVTAPGSFLQIAGLKVEYDLSQPPGRRVRSLTIRCRDCDNKTYYPIVPYRTYIIGMPSFMHQGRDGFYNFEDYGRRDHGQFDCLLIVEHLRKIYEVEPKLDGRIKFYQSNLPSNSSFDPPLPFGDPAPEHEKLNGVLVTSMNEQDSTTDIKKETSEIKHHKENESTFVSSDVETALENSSHSFLINEKSTILLNRLEREKHNDNLTKTLSTSENVDFKDEEDVVKVIESNTNDLNYRHINKIDLIVDTRSNQTDQKKSLNQSYVPEIPPDLHKRMAEFYHESSMPQENIDEDIDKISEGNESILDLFSEFFIQPVKLKENKYFLVTENKTIILNNSKFFELLNTNSTTIASSLENISNKFPEFPGRSDLLKRISHLKELKKRSIENQMDENENINNYFGFKTTILNFVKNLKYFFGSNTSVNNTSSPFEEREKVSEENIKKAFEEFFKMILTDAILSTLFKNQTGLMNIMNTTVSDENNLT